jgi:sarcosine oxidase subunit beta
MTPKVVIVGGGAVGLSAALTLAERGCSDVTVIERSHVAAGSSGLSAGIFTRQYMERRDVEMRAESYRRLCQLEREDGLVLIRNGFVRLARDGETLAAFEAGAEVQREAGVNDARVVGRAELQELVPDLRCDDLEGGMFGPSDGYLDGQQLCMAYAERAEPLGVRIAGWTELEGIERGAGTRHRLLTSRGPLDCDVVVNAAGAWAPRVGDLLGAPVPTISQRHEACVMRLPRRLGYVMPSVMDYVPGGGEPGLYFRQDGHEQLIAGLHTNDLLEGEVDDPDSYFGGVEECFVDRLVPRLLERLPTLEDIGYEGGWSGLYPNSPDGRFIVGPHPAAERVIAACGLNGVGVYLSPIIGTLVAEWVVDGEARSVAGASDFLPGRFGHRALSGE